jgi:hypothetical protein
MSAAPDLVYIRNNTKNPKVVPLALGRPKGKSSRVLTFDPGLNSLQPEVLRMITGGGLLKDGSAKGGSAGKYFDNRQLQKAHAPLEGDECHEVTTVIGIKRSRRSMSRRAERERTSKMEAILFALLGQSIEDMSPADVAAAVSRSGDEQPQDEEVLLDPSDYTVSELEDALDGLDLDELCEVLKLEKARDGGPRKGAVALLLTAMSD